MCSGAFCNGSYWYYKIKLISSDNIGRPITSDIPTVNPCASVVKSFIRSSACRKINIQTHSLLVHLLSLSFSVLTLFCFFFLIWLLLLICAGIHGRPLDPAPSSFCRDFLEQLRTSHWPWKLFIQKPSPPTDESRLRRQDHMSPIYHWWFCPFNKLVRVLFFRPCRGRSVPRWCKTWTCAHLKRTRCKTVKGFVSLAWQAGRFRILIEAKSVSSNIRWSLRRLI